MKARKRPFFRDITVTAAVLLLTMVSGILGMSPFPHCPAWAQTPSLKGDLNGDCVVDLVDALLGLQATSKMDVEGIRPAYSISGADVNDDGKIGLSEVLFDILVAAGLRSPGNADVSELDPLSGPVGSVVTLTGANFDPQASYTVTINGTPANVVDVTPTSIQFGVAPGTTSGQVVVSGGEGDPISTLPFEVTRTINGLFNPPQGVSITGYEISSGAEFTQPDQNDGSFTVTVPLDFTGIVWAFRNEEDPVFFAVVSSTHTLVTIDATSTAKALAFISPFLATRDDAKTLAIFDRMTGLSEVATFAGLIASISGDGADYLKDSRVEMALQSLISALVNPGGSTSTSYRTTLAFESGTPAGTKLKEINPDYSAKIPATKVRLDSQLKGISPKNWEDYILQIDAIQGTTNPLDWPVEVFELSLAQFDDGFQSIDASDFNDTFDFLDERPIATGYVTAKLGSEKMDLLGMLADIIKNKLFSLGPHVRNPNEFPLPVDVPTVYVSQAYSGNIWYGTRRTSSQKTILKSEDIHHQWAFALAGNITIAAIDIASVAINLKDYMSRKELADILQSVFTNFAKSVAIMQKNGDEINVTNAYGLLKTVTKTVIKLAASKLAEKGLLATVGRFSKGTAKTLFKVFDITGKISSVEQSLERTAGYTLPNALAIERSIVVIGDPFNPVIDRVFPNVGQEGERVVIGGRNFGFPLPEGEYTNDPNEDISVCFCQFSATSTDPENEPPNACLNAEILRRTNTQISVTVPDNFEATFQNNVPVYLCVNKNGKETSSYHLAEQGQFELLGPPEIIAVTPNVVLQGSFFRVTGNRLGNNSVAVIDDTFPVKPIRGDDGSMLVALPPPSTAGFGDGAHTIKIKRGNKESPPTNFTIGFPQHTPSGSTLSAGWTILVTRLDMTNSADDHEISMLEAMLLANGSLGRLPELHALCEETGDCEWQEREVDHIPNFFDPDKNPRPGGPLYRDSIHVSGSGTVAASGAWLPPVGNGDSIDFNGIILDGTGAGGHGLSLDNVSNAAISDVRLMNFSGDGLHLANESKDNVFNNIAIETITGNGISLFNHCSGNDFNKVTVTGAGGHGIFIEDHCDFNSFYDCTVSTTTGSGIRIEGGSVQNSFSYPDQDPFDAFMPTLYKPGGHGIHLTGGANRNSFRNIFIADAGGSGIFLEGDAQENYFDKMVVTHPTLNGMHLSGNQVRFNRSLRHKLGKLSDLEAAWDLEDVYEQAGGYGILIENGANSNLLGPRQVYNNARGGIRVDGEDTENNFIGKHYRFEPFNENAILPSIIYDNGSVRSPNGHGIHISNGAGNNTLELMNVAGNQGDGICVEGSATTLNHISGIWTGLVYFFPELTAPLSLPNTGNSLHIANGASANVIGGLSIARNNFSNDLRNGVLIEGEETIENVIRDTDIGRTPSVTRPGYTSFSSQFSGVGQSGIAIVRRANGNIIGSMETDLRVHIDASPDAGILIDGSDSNLVIGCFFGSPFEYIEFEENEKNRIGIHIRNGARGNRIGQIGPMLGADPNPAGWTGIVDRLNQITHVREAGIWIENAGGSFDLAGNRTLPNVLHNNYIESEGVGLKISGDSHVNDIGGWRGGPAGEFVNIFESFTQEDNYIQGEVAGVCIDGVIIGNPAARNRFLNNIIAGEIDQEDPAKQRDLRAGPPPGVGVLITGNGFGSIVGESIKAPNIINMSRVGIYIDGARGNLIRGNKIGSSFTPNTIAGVVVRNGRDNEVGGGLFDGVNILEGNGLLGYGFTGPTANPDASGVLIVAGESNTVQNNEINANSGEGILLIDSKANAIGGPRRVHGNIITDNTGNGIAIKGTGSTENMVQSNLIGTNRKGDMLGNQADGICISEGGTRNLIGGSGPVTVARNTFNLPAPNIIAHNMGHGVHVSGGGTTGNSILLNSIYGNGVLGIENESGGNHELPPPIHMSYGAGVISGEVADINLVPAGSIINVFSDLGAQGEVFLGQTIVKPGGTWTISGLLPAPLPNITATVTHATEGSTSEFAPAGDLIRGFNIQRADGQPPGQQTVTFGQGDIPLLVLEAVAVGDTVVVNQLTLEAAGSLLDHAEIAAVSLYRDNNRDAQITEVDTLIAGPFTYDADNGQVSLDLPGPVVEPDYPQQWIVVYKTSQAVAQGTTFSAKITSPADVNADFLFPVGVVAIPAGPFPVASDEFTVGPL